MGYSTQTTPVPQHATSRNATRPFFDTMDEPSTCHSLTNTAPHKATAVTIRLMRMHASPSPNLSLTRHCQVARHPRLPQLKQNAFPLGAAKTSYASYYFLEPLRPCLWPDASRFGYGKISQNIKTVMLLLFYAKLL